MSYEDLYKSAIEERRHHQANYNHWMNMYAIFTGALFIAFYQLIGSNSEYKNLLLFVVTSLGTICSWCWFFSCRGWYRWIISWISIVSWYEAKLVDGAGQPVYLYRLFADPKAKSNENYKFPFSTPKLTQIFVCIIAVAWSFCLLAVVVNGWCPIILSSLVKCNIFNIIIFVLGIIIAIAVPFILGKVKTRENLSCSHKLLCIPQENDNRLTSEKMVITDFKE